MTDKDSRRWRGYPKVITDLPEAEIPFAGVRGWIAQGEDHQLLFFDMESTAVVPEHSHGYAQWGTVLEGEMELSIGGKARVYRRGEDYTIPAGVKHSARFLTRSRVMDFFQEKARYEHKVR